VQAEGYVIPSAIKHIPIAGRDLTAFVQQVRANAWPELHVSSFLLA
jgi:hypothetical protein